MKDTKPTGLSGKSLRRRLTLQIASFVGVSMLIITGLVAYLMSANLTEQMRNQLKSATRYAQMLLEQRLDYLQENTQRLTSNPFVINGLVDSEGRGTYLPKLAENFSKGRNVLSFILVDYDGRPLFKTRENSPDYNQSLELRTALARGEQSMFIQQPEHHLVIVAPISYYDTTQGAVIVAFDLAAITRQYIHHDPRAYHRLLQNRTVIDEYNYEPDIDYLSYRHEGESSVPLLQQLGITVEVGLPASNYLEPVWLDIFRFLLISVLFIAAAVLISARIGNGIAEPILTLHRRVLGVDHEERKRCAPLGTNDELEELAHAFDHRTHELTSAQAALERDIEKRIKTQAELDRVRHYLQNIIDSMPSMLIGIDKVGNITLWNQHAEQSSGVRAEDARGRGLEQVLPMLSTQMERVRMAIEKHQTQHLTRQIHTIDDENHYADVTIYPLVANAAVGAVIRIDDITERVRMEEMMMQTEKMMSVGGLAAGMAHEINNPLGGILQGLQNIRRRFSTGLSGNIKVANELNLDLEAVHRYMEQRQIFHFMDEMADAGKRASDIVINMLQFSRKAEMNLEAEDINALLDKTLDLAAVDYDLKKRYDFRQIEIVRDYDSTIPAVPCIASEIQQVLLNLLRNAAQAMQRQGEGVHAPRITVHTRIMGDFVRIEVEDNGPGMEAKVKARVFEPFFTTRPVGEGTGLGLSVSYFIIHDEHGGRMSVESQPGAGATFVVELPLKPKEK